MEIKNKKYLDTVKALSTLKDILKEPYSVIVRDATIQRFEYTFESLWKYLKTFLKESEGVIANSPKAVFKECFNALLFDEELTTTCLEMTDMRNETAHTYQEFVSEKIFKKIPDYVIVMDKILNTLK